MISDVVCEYLVKKKLNAVQIAKAAGVVVPCIILTWLMYAVGVVIDHTGLMPSMLFCCGVALGVYLLRRVVMVEYEYTLVNGELTVDRILAKSSRKNMLEVDVKAFEKLGKYDAETVSKLNAGRVLDYSADKSDPGTLFAYFKDEKTNANTVLLFTPNQKMLDGMKSSVSATVYREAFRK